MKLKHLALATVFVSATIFAAGAQARIGSAMGGQPQAQPESAADGYGQGHRRGNGHGQYQPPAPPPQPPAPQPPAPPQQFGGGNPGYGQQGGYRPPRPPQPPTPPHPGQYGGGHPGYPPQGGYRPPRPPQPPVPPHPGQYGGYGPQHPGYAGQPGRHRDWDRKRRRERYRDAAPVILGLGVLGALAAQPRYDDPYYAYPPAPPEPGYAPYPGDGGGYPDDSGDYADGYGGQPGTGTIRCASNDYRTTWCAIPQGARANIRRRLSSSACDYGRDWGVGPGAIWVANGCRAEFSIY